MTDFLEKTFRLKEHQTDVRTEILAGITTFMTMAYILAVNPGILSAAGMDAGAVFTATALGACLGTLLMALFSNYPFALAPGMGLNAFFAYTVVGQMGYSWQVALAAVFVEGVLFIVLSLTKVREALFNSIPPALKAVSVCSLPLSACRIPSWLLPDRLSLACIRLRLLWQTAPSGLPVSVLCWHLSVFCLLR